MMAASNVQDIYPLSPLQAGMLFHSLAQPDSGLYFEQYLCDLEGRLDPDAFGRAWQAAVDRHDTLRTHFAWEKLDKPVQVVRERVNLPFERLDWSAETDTQRARLLEDYLRRDRRRGFDLDKAPLMRVALIRMRPESHVMIWSFHHGVMDGWSGTIVLADVFAYYEANRQGAIPPPSPAPPPYKNYIRWIQRQDTTAAERFWREHLKGVAAPNPINLTAPEGTPIAEAERYQALQLALDPDTTTHLRQFAQRQRITFNTLVQGGWAMVVGAYSGEDDVLFGATVSGRGGDLPGVDAMVGLFINTLPVRATLVPGQRVGDWLRELQTQQARASQFEYSALVDIQGWTAIPRNLPLFNSVLVFENYPMGSAAPGATLGIRNVRAREVTNYPLTAAVMPADEMVLQITFDRTLFGESAIRRMLEHWRNAIIALARDPQAVLGSISVLDGDERHRLAVERNRTAMDYPRDKSITELFDARAAGMSGSCAFIHGDRRITVGDIATRANRLANRLRALGARRGALVAIGLERSFDATISMLAVCKTGAAYVPIDPNYPRDRLAYILEDSGATIVITHSRHLDRLPPTTAQVVCLDREWPAIEQESAEAPADGATADDVAYVLYTSGSTGAPKGVMGTHRGAVNRFFWMYQEYGFAPGELCAMRSSLSFADHIWENFGPMLAGVPSLILDEEVVRDVRSLVATLSKHRVTRVILVPGMIRALLDVGGDLRGALAHLRICVASGEAVPVDVGRRFCDALPACILLNLYGASETTADAMAYEINSMRGAPANTPIGRPIANTQIYLLDARRQLVPEGVPGEIYIGGDSLAKGYFGKPDLTAERFSRLADFSFAAPEPVPAGLAQGAVFKSGDLGRWLPDGNLEYLGRVDFQVKIRGNRVELGEVEVALGSHPDVAQAVVTGPADANGDRRLVAYVVFRAGCARPQHELRAHLAARLPDFMLPAAFVTLERMPLTPSGKVNRRALPTPDLAGAASGPHIAPRTDAEASLTAIWEECLGIKPIGVTQDFFELGGHSLIAMRIFARIEQRLGVRAPVNLLSTAGTIEKLARVLYEPQTGLAVPHPALVPLQTDGTRTPLFIVHGLGGGVLDYAAIARAAGADRLVFGLKPAGFDDGNPAHATIEEMAAYYVQAIRAQSPKGPVFVGGHCFGGVVAFEVARQLTERGLPVHGVLLLDSYTPEPNNRAIAWRHPLRFTRNTLGFLRAYGYGYPFRRAALLARRNVLDRDGYGVRERGIRLEDVMVNASEINDDVRELTTTQLRALMRHHPGTFSGPVSLFRVRVQPMFRAHQPQNGWETHVPLGVRVIMVEGTHTSMVNNPSHARVLGEILREEMARLDAIAPAR